MQPDLQSENWQRLPGTGIDGCALVHTADLTCCNTGLLRSTSCFAVIDPGGTEEHLAEVCRRLEDGSGRPVLVLLTHVHRDHARALLWMKRHLSVPCFYVAQASGAAALERGDGDVSASFVYGEEGIRCAMDGVLLGAAEAAPLPVLAGCRFGVVQTRESGGATVRTQTITTPEGDVITAFHTPGHSDDSVCYQVGSMLFCGDILFAHRPVVAGLPGWSPEHLLQSLRFLDACLSEGSVEVIWCGHGRALDGPAARSIAANVMRETSQMGALARLDAGRMQFLRECAVVLMREVSMQMAAQGGRLLRIASALSEWEEEDLARSLRRDVDMEAMDRCIEEFHAFEQMQTGDSMLAAVPMKGVEMIRKMGKVLKGMDLPVGLGGLYLARLDFLLNDYIALMLGLDVRRGASATPIQPVLKEVLGILKPPPPDHDTLAALAEDAAAFGVYLAGRLDEQGRRSTVSLNFPDADGPLVLVERTRLSVLLGDLLETLLSGEERHVEIAACRRDALCGLHLQTVPPLHLSERKTQFYDLLVRLSGGRFSSDAGHIWLLLPEAGRDASDSIQPGGDQEVSDS